MMKMKLRDIVFGNFNNMIKLSAQKLNIKDSSIFYNNNRLDIYNKSVYSYEGKNCGYVTSLIMGEILRKNNLNVEMKLAQTDSNNHIFLTYDDLIIDTTYRQFLTDNRKNNTSNYNNYIYNIMQPIYVGTKYDLFKQILHINRLNKQEFGYSKMDIELFYNWYEIKDITHKFEK